MDPVLSAVVDKVTTSECELVSDPDLANSLACDLWRHRNKEIRQQPCTGGDLQCCPGQDDKALCKVTCFDSPDDNFRVSRAIARANAARLQERRRLADSAFETPAGIPLDYIREAFEKEPNKEREFLRW